MTNLTNPARAPMYTHRLHKEPRAFAGVLSVLLLLMVSCGGEPKDVVLFRVNGQEVYRSELELLARNGMVKAGIRPGTADAEKWFRDHVENLYDSLINLYLIQQAALATEEEPGDDEIDRAIEEFKNLFPDDSEYEQMLEAAKLTPDEVRVIFRNWIMVDRFQATKMKEGQKDPTMEQMRHWYEAHIGDFRAPNRMRFRHILFKADRGASPEERAAIRQTAEQVRRDLAGADEETFSRTAREISDDTLTAPKGGDLGFISKRAARESFPRGVVESIFHLREGEISPVFQSELGYHIFMAVDGWQEFEEALEEVRTRVVHQSMVTAFSNWLAEARRKADIEMLVPPEEVFPTPTIAAS